jgi:hypothetical protein
MGARFSTLDDFECFRVDTLDRGVAEAGSRPNPSSGPAQIRRHHRLVRGAWIDGQHMDTFAPQLATQRFAEPGKARLGGRAGGIEGRTDQGDPRGHVDHHRVAAAMERR